MCGLSHQLMATAPNTPTENCLAEPSVVLFHGAMTDMLFFEVTQFCSGLLGSNRKLEHHGPFNFFYKKITCAHFGSTYTKIGMIQRRLAWPLSKDDMQIHEAFHIFMEKRQPL